MPRKSRGRGRENQISRWKAILGQLYSQSREDRILNIVDQRFPVGCPLPISTRGIGFMIIHIVKELKRQSRRYVENMPDLSTIYRASLAQLETKMDESLYSGQHYAFFDRVSEYDDRHMPFERSQMVKFYGWNLSGIALIINSIGRFEYQKKKFRPVFQKKLSPLNLRITNLREYCDKMADLETETPIRMNGYRLNSIPGAIWKREDENDPDSIHLTNPDEIIPENYDDSHLLEDLEAFRRWIGSLTCFASDSVTEINYKGDGNAGLLVSVLVDPGDTLRIENDLIEGDEKDFWSVHSIDENFWGLGIIGLMGEISDPMEIGHRSKMIRATTCRYGWKAAIRMMERRRSYDRMIGATSSTHEALETTLNFSLQLPVANLPCPLEISTRGIGFMLAEVTNRIKDVYPKLRDEIPTAAMYRASLAQLEAKIVFSGYFRSSSLSHQVTHAVENIPYNLIQIVLLINSVGPITHQGMCFEPRFAEETSPLSLRITNLRKYCEEMANPETDPAKRVAGYKLNSIPNAKWRLQNGDDPDSIILSNPDEIIRSDYSIDRDLEQDLSNTHCFVTGRYQYYYKKYGRDEDTWDSIDFHKIGDPGILVSTEIFPDQCLRLDESNWVVNNGTKEFWSRECLDPYSWYAGTTSLVGEVSNSPIVSHRSKNLAVYECDINWGQLCSI